MLVAAARPLVDQAAAGPRPAPRRAQAHGDRTVLNVLLPSLAAPELGSCGSSGRAWWPRAAQHSQGGPRPVKYRPRLQLLELAASKAADFTGFDHPGDVTAQGLPAALAVDVRDVPGARGAAAAAARGGLAVADDQPRRGVRLHLPPPTRIVHTWYRLCSAPPARAVRPPARAYSTRVGSRCTPEPDHACPARLLPIYSWTICSVSARQASLQSSSADA